METADLLCVYPDCPNTRRTRGLCHGHYQTMRSRVRVVVKLRGKDAGEALEADLVRRGLMTHKGTGGAMGGGDTLGAFSIGSDARGRMVSEE